MKNKKELHVGQNLGANSKDHWEMNVNITPAGIPNDPAGAFLPMSGKNRPQPHKKINECDH